MIDPDSKPSVLSYGSCQRTLLLDGASKSYPSVWPDQQSDEKRALRPYERIIPKMPEILKEEGWPVASEVFAKWLACKNALRPRTLIQPPYMITWAWYLGPEWGRTRNAMNEIARRLNESLAAGETWATPFLSADTKQRAEIVERWNKVRDALKDRQSVLIVAGDPDDEKSLKPGEVRARYIGAEALAQWKRMFYVDDNYATLGSHGIKVYVTGSAARIKGNAKQVLLKIESFYVRVKDGFNFQEDQYLGEWTDHKFAGLATRLKYAAGARGRGDPEPEQRELPTVELTNALFRRYAKENGLDNCDFFVQTPMRLVEGIKLPQTKLVDLQW